jgi:hypothetical protein
MAAKPPAAAIACSVAGVARLSSLPGCAASAQSKGADNLTLCQFGTDTAKHWFCKTCGIYTHFQRRSDPGQYGVKAALLDRVNPSDLGEVPWTDGVNHPSDRSKPS